MIKFLVEYRIISGYTEPRVISADSVAKLLEYIKRHIESKNKFERRYFSARISKIVLEIDAEGNPITENTSRPNIVLISK